MSTMTGSPTASYFLGLILISMAIGAANIFLVGHEVSGRGAVDEEERLVALSTTKHHQLAKRQDVVSQLHVEPANAHRTKRKKRRLEEDGFDPDHRQRIYHQRLLNSRYARYHSSYSNSTEFLLKATDSIYRLDFASPIVLEEHRLVFFAVPKAACTVFKQLFRRISGYSNWKKQNNDLPHNLRVNGLKLLRDYSVESANDMLTNRTWTRAIFVRDPRERLLSAYLDKGRKENLINKWCCPETNDCGSLSAKSFKNFLTEVMPNCLNDHWSLQARRFEPKFFYSINFIGRVENAAQDTRQMLIEMRRRNHVNDGGGDALWNKYCASGWGQNGSEHIFQGISNIRHGTSSSDKMKQYYNSPEIERLAEEMLRLDLEHPLFQFSPSLSPPSSA